MAWRKLGRVFQTPGDTAWAKSHAAYPTANLRSPDCLRVYYTALDAGQFGQGGYVDLDPRDPLKVLDVAPAPVITLGEAGDFDDAGANPFSVVDFRGQKRMYYLGWQRTLRAPYQTFTGLAFEGADGRFEKWRRVPVLERTHEEPHIRGAPYIVPHGDRLRLWYTSSSQWTELDGQLHYHVLIRHAVSDDGISWTVDPHVCLEPGPGEYALGRPSVIMEGGLYRMWYSIRKFEHPYAIGYAESRDGIRWTRMDEAAGISRSETDWDSEMICFPNVIRVGDQLLMFYNGNNHGASGFGCAVWES